MPVVKMKYGIDLGTTNSSLCKFEDGELNYAGQSYSQLSTRAGNGWDVNLVGILLNHIFSQIL